MTGFDFERARPHDQLLEDLRAFLETRGYHVEVLPVEGDDPDLRIIDLDGKPAYVDLKVTEQANLVVKTGALHGYIRRELQGQRVYIVWKTGAGATVDSPWSMMGRMIGGPRRPTGKGSLTDWYLIRPGGTPITEFFPAKE